MKDRGQVFVDLVLHAFSFPKGEEEKILMKGKDLLIWLQN
jgi:hypothetical protein